MTIPGTQGAGAVFGGLGEGNVDMSGGYMPLLEEIRKRRMLEQGIGMGPDPAGMLRPPPPQQQMASMMGDIRPTAANPMINPNPQAPQMQQGVGMGPNPLGAGVDNNWSNPFGVGVGGPVAMPPRYGTAVQGQPDNARMMNLGTPPPPPAMASPYERAMAETPKPGPRGIGGALKEGLSSMLAGQGVLRGLTGAYGKDEYKRKLAEKAAIYGEGDAFRRAADADQMKKNEFNLKVREQGSREKLGEGRLDLMEQNIEEGRRKGEEQRADYAEKRRIDEENKKRDDALNLQRFEVWKQDLEGKLGRMLNRDEDDQAYRQFQMEAERARIGISGAHLGLEREKWNEEKKNKIPKDLEFRDGAWYRIKNGTPYRLPDQEWPGGAQPQQNPLTQQPQQFFNRPLRF